MGVPAGGAKSLRPDPRAGGFQWADRWHGAGVPVAPFSSGPSPIVAAWAGR